MSKYKNYLLSLLFTGFIIMGVSAYFQSRPEEKNMHIYQEIKQYSPYYLDKRFGGLQIMSKSDKEFKEQPSNMEVFHRLDALEKEWGKGHLKVEKDELKVLDDTNSTIATITIKNEDELRFVHRFYGIQ